MAVIIPPQVPAFPNGSVTPAIAEGSSTFTTGVGPGLFQVLMERCQGDAAPGVAPVKDTREANTLCLSLGEDTDRIPLPGSGDRQSTAICTPSFPIRLSFQSASVPAALEANVGSMPERSVLYEHTRRMSAAGVARQHSGDTAAAPRNRSVSHGASTAPELGDLTAPSESPVSPPAVSVAPAPGSIQQVPAGAARERVFADQEPRIAAAEGDQPSTAFLPAKLSQPQPVVIFGQDAAVSTKGPNASISSQISGQAQSAVSQARSEHVDLVRPDSSSFQIASSRSASDAHPKQVFQNTPVSVAPRSSPPTSPESGPPAAGETLQPVVPNSVASKSRQTQPNADSSSPDSLLQFGSSVSLHHPTGALPVSAPSLHERALPSSAVQGSPAPISGGDVFRSLDGDSSLPPGAWIHASGHHAAAGYLDPSLGWIGVRVEGAGGNIHASLVPSSANTAEFLGGHITDLRTFLEDRHAHVASVDVATNAGSAGSSPDANSQGRQSNSSSPERGMPSNARESFASASEGTAVKSSRPSLASIPWSTNGRVSDGHISVLA